MKEGGATYPTKSKTFKLLKNSTRLFPDSHESFLVLRKRLQIVFTQIKATFITRRRFEIAWNFFVMLGLVTKGLMSIETEYHFLTEGQYIIETS